MQVQVNTKHCKLYFISFLLSLYPTRVSLSPSPWFKGRNPFNVSTKSHTIKAEHFCLGPSLLCVLKKTCVCAHAHTQWSKGPNHIYTPTRSYMYSRTNKHTKACSLRCTYLAMALMGLLLLFFFFIEYRITESHPSLSLPADWTLSTLSIKDWIYPAAKCNGAFSPLQSALDLVTPT